MESSWRQLEMEKRNELHRMTDLVGKIIQNETQRQRSLDLMIQAVKDERAREATKKKQPSGDQGGDELLLSEHHRVSVAVQVTQDFNLPKLEATIERLQEEAPKFQSDLDFLLSIHFPGIRTRHRGIRSAYPQTFDWMLTDGPIEPSVDVETPAQITAAPNGNVKDAARTSLEAATRQLEQGKQDQGLFSQWLSSESGIFWIHGKPGCGKSTLMKFLCDHPKTTEKLQEWAAPKRLEIAHYFFWRAGSQHQRSQTGLLRSLIFDMIRKSPALLPVAKSSLPTRKADLDEPENEKRDWTIKELLDMYKAMVAEEMTTRFCFFIDGLDEYYDSEKKPYDLIKTIRELELSQDVKLCISSRPYPVFDEEFGKNKGRVLKVEEHTRSDIRHYVEERFRATGNFASLQRRDPAYATFVDEVSERAEGVFLWVVLVVASLENGVANSDSVTRLRARLNQYPPDLDEFFLVMLKSVEAEYRKQAMRTFELVTSTLQPLHAMFFWYFYRVDDDGDAAGEHMWRHVRRMQGEQVDDMLRDLRRIIQARSQGLLEVVEDGDHAEAFFRYKVDFIHRTVRDFLRSATAVKDQFESELRDEPLSTWRIACRAVPALFRAAPRSGLREEDFLQQLVRDMYLYAGRASSDRAARRRVPRETAARWLQHVEYLMNQEVSTFTNRQPPRRFFLCLDAQYGFERRVAERLRGHAATLRLNHGLGHGNSRPVLDHALVAAPGEGPVYHSAVVVEVLLKHGADPGSMYLEEAVWQRFLAHLVNTGGGTGAAGELADAKLRQTRVRIMQLLLSSREKDCLKARIETEWGSRSAEAVLRELLTTEEQDQISQLRHRSWFKSLFSRG